MVAKKQKTPKTGDKKGKTPSKKSAKTMQKTGKKSAKSAPKPQKKAQSTRKMRTDSVEHHVTVAQATLQEIRPPDHVKLLKAEERFWDSIIREFAKVEWTDHTLELAAMLARHMYGLDLEQRKLKKEGTLLDRKTVIPAVKDKSTGKEITPAKVVVVSQYLNPRKNMVSMYSELIVKFRRSLSLHARGMEGEARDLKKRRGMSKALEESISHEDDDDGLLAKPTLQ